MAGTLGFSGLHVRFSQVFLYPGVNYMPIPSHFAEMIEVARPAWVTFSTSDKLRWDLQIVEENGATFFSKGWSTFHNAYELEVGDNVFFVYNKKSHFAIYVFERNGREKPSAKPTAEQPVQDVTPNKELVKAPTQSLESRRQLKGKTIMQRNLGVKGGVKKLPAAYPGMIVGFHKGEPSNKNFVVNQSTDRGKKQAEGVGNNYLPNESDEKIDSFFVEIEPCHLAEGDHLLVPLNNFARRYFARPSNALPLNVSWSQVWHVIRQQHEGATKIIAGWQAFVAENKLKVGDCCRFEL